MSKTPAGGATSASTPRSHRLYKQATEQQKRLAAKVVEAQNATPSFKPKLVAKPVKSASPEGKDVFSSLYDRAMQQRHKLDEMAEQGGGLNEDCVFRPHVTKKAHKKGKGARRRLYDADAMLKKQKAREELKARRETQECTFSPELVSKKSRAAPSESDKRRKVYEKLFSQAKSHDEKLKAATESARRAEQRTCTFVPSINKNAASPSKAAGDVGARLYKSGVELRARHMASAAKGRMEDCTFKPAISSVSAKIAKGEGPVHERLFKDAAKRPKRADKVKPAPAWETLLREAAPAGAMITKVVAMTAEQKEVFDRLYKQQEQHSEKTSESVFVPAVDWEIMLRAEGEAATTPATKAAVPVAVDEEAVKKQADFLQRMSEDAKRKGAARAGDVGAVDFTRMLRAADAPSQKTAAARAAAPSSDAVNRLHKTQTASSAAAAKTRSDALQKETMMRTCWHATLRTDHPVALQTVVEAV